MIVLHFVGILVRLSRNSIKKVIMLQRMKSVKEYTFLVDRKVFNGTFQGEVFQRYLLS